MSNQNPAQTEENNQFDINESSYKTSHAAVRKARRFALQGLYEWLMTDHRFEQMGEAQWKANPPHDIAARTRATNAMHTVHLGYYHTLMRDIPQQIDELEALIKPYLDREISKIDMVEHAVLLIGAYELQHSLHIPYKVVLDEAMKLNTHFGATDAHKLINAVMDKLAAQLREVEVQADIGGGYKQKQKQASASKAQDAADAAEASTDSVDVDKVTADNAQDGEQKAQAKPRLSLKSKKDA
ncbi:transcription antitermination factor NusB [Psychrobacter sp. FDAARGOS_221]|uniref:transcription antitermination factor NusB n=1 Tax=Psychrobacter sp. FDAARGOS_221 TaxID=1975705 RepID=UPI001D0D09DB|nr:transcription antitermination factor NusB [Psychrobacter sp. FDAARGOS_221]